MRIYLHFFFAFLIFIQFISVTFTKVITTSSKILTLSEFVSSLIATRFNHCTFLIAETKPENVLQPRNIDFEKILETILSQTSQDSFVIELPNSKESTSNSQRGLEGNITKFDIITDLHQHRDKCTVGLFVIQDYWPSFSQELYDLTSKWFNILKKDEDYYFYLTKDESASKDLLIPSSSIGLKVKFKAVIQQASSGEILMRSTCFYCAQGEPKIISIDWGHASQDNLHSRAVHLSPLTDLFPDFVLNMQGKVMKVSAPTSTRWLMEIRHENGVWVSKRGVYKFLMDHFMVKYNFTCDFFISTGGGGTGLLLKNGTWVGTVGDIVNNRADIAHTTGLTWHRNKVVGYTYPMTYETLSFTSGEPLPFFSWQAVFWPLDAKVWLWLGVSYLTVNLFLYIINRTARIGNKKIDKATVVAYTWSSILEQDLPVTDTFVGHPIRVFISFWLIYALVITTAYRSKLVSFLAFPNVEKLPTTFEELAKSDFHLALQYLGGAAFQILRTSTNPTYQTIFKRMELEPVDAKCFERAIGNRFVCISWITVAEFVYRRNLSDQNGRAPLVKAPDSTCFLPGGIIMEKRAIFRTNFNSFIVYASDGGLIDRWRDMDLDDVYRQRRRWEEETNKTKVSYPVAESLSALTNNHFKGSYYILCLGAFLSLVAFLGEMLKYVLQGHQINLLQWFKCCPKGKVSNIITTIKDGQRS